MKPMPRNFIASIPLGLSLLLTGCSQDVASVDDVYVPASPAERFPIAIQQVPVKLTLQAGGRSLSADDSERLLRFANHARSEASEITVSYPSGSLAARATAQEIERILTRGGISRKSIHVTHYDGMARVVALSYLRKVAVTEPCGNWSRNIANDGANEAYPNFGCTAQHNLAAMVANPEDLRKPRTMTASPAAGRMPAMKKYESGEWSTEPAELPSATSDN
jgi:pilus assembly protein CpaD